VVIEALNSGADFYLQKGGNPQAQFAELAHKIRRAIQVKSAQKEKLEIIQGSPIPEFVIDSNHRVIFWNRALEEYSGIRAADIIGTIDHWKAFYDHQRPCLADLIVDKNIDGITRWYAGKQAKSSIVNGAYEATDFFPRIKGGTWLFFTAAPLRDNSGQVIGAIETLQDITAIRKKEDELRIAYEQIAASEEELRSQYDELKRNQNIIWQNEHFLQSVFSSIQDGISVLDKTMTIVRVNPTMERWHPHAVPLVGRKCYEAYHGRQERCEVCPSFATLSTGQHAYESVPIVDKEKNVHWIDLYSSPLINTTTGELEGVIEYTRDITARKKAEEELKAAYEKITASEEELRNKLGEMTDTQQAIRLANSKMRLLSDVTRHDIKNQLTSLLSLLDLSRTMSPHPKMNEFIDKLVAISETINAQVDFMRDYQELGILEPRWFDVHDLVTKAASHLDMGTIRLVNNQDNLEIYADPLIEKVFYNLIDNAVKHGETISRISVRSREVPTGYLIVVEDNGNGIRNENKEKIFQHRSGTNTGFGLFLTREILSITGITIKETGHHTKGARFEILVRKGNSRTKNQKK
jgi:PAS domain S-box-containing protein